jgi:hypothetical protein
MPSWLIRLRDIVWTSVISVALVVVALVSALIYPEAMGFSLTAGVSAVALAILSTKD